MVDATDDDIVIQDTRNGYFCAQVGSNTDFDQMIQEISDYMEAEQFWPNVFYVNDHSNTELLAIHRNENGVAKHVVVESWV